MFPMALSARNPRILSEFPRLVPKLPPSGTIPGGFAVNVRYAEAQASDSTRPVCPRWYVTMIATRPLGTGPTKRVQPMRASEA